jgi:TatD DNase family protein
MFDIGVNLTSRQLVGDAADLLERAMAAGVTGIAITGTSAAESAQAASLCNELQPAFPGVICCTAGVHPHHASEWNEQTKDQISELAKLPQVVAIGETGLDFNRNFSSPEDQLHAFEEQLKLAAQTGLPVFLHEREAFDEQITLLRKYREHISGGVAHCFTGSREQLHAYLDLGLYIGITGWVCDERRGQELAGLVPEIPLDKLLIETDAPWLLPRNIQPKPKSKINQPAYLSWISRQVADLLNVSELEVRDQTFKNALALFSVTSN